MRIKRDIQSQAALIFKTLTESKWADYSAELTPLLPIPDFDGHISVDDLARFNLKKIWPCLTLVSAWDSATSRFYYDELRSQFSGLNFQGKGLWATEAAITIPFSDKKVLAYKSHYYQFKCVQTGKIHSAWQLQKDQIVEPIITASNGLVRYLIEDRIQVSDFYNQVPCFEFLGRNSTSDLVGEKLTDMDFQKLQKELLRKFPISNVLFFAVNAEVPFYQCLCEMKEQNKNSLPHIQFLLRII